MIGLRSGVFNLGFALWTLVLGLVALPLLMGRRGGIVALSRVWVRGVLGWLRVTTGIRFEIKGRHHVPSGPCLVAMKHQSALETLILPLMFQDPAIVLKQELLKIPVFGWYLGRTAMIAIDRKAGSAALRHMVQGARDAVAAGRSVIIYPEGTRAPLGTYEPYHTGVMALYRDLDLPLVPVALNSGLYWRGLWEKRPGRVIVEILPPLEPGQDRRAIMAQLEQRIESATHALLVAGGWQSGSVDKSVNNLETTHG